MPAPDWPAPDAGLALHRRLLDLDPVATAAFTAAYYPPLLADLRQRNPRVGEDLFVTVVSDLLFAFVRDPGKYHPDRAPLRSYLLLAAAGDVKNALAKIGRRKKHESSLDAVAEPAAAGNEEGDEDWLADPRVAAEVAAFTSVEQAVWQLRLTGERRTGVYAVAMGITGLPVGEQEREVKKLKERLTKRLRRLREDTP